MTCHIYTMPHRRPDAIPPSAGQIINLVDDSTKPDGPRTSASVQALNGGWGLFGGIGGGGGVDS